jgi:hypothetical protein
MTYMKCQCRCWPVKARGLHAKVALYGNQSSCLGRMFLLYLYRSQRSCYGALPPLQQPTKPAAMAVPRLAPPLATRCRNCDRRTYNWRLDTSQAVCRRHRRGFLCVALRKTCAVFAAWSVRRKRRVFTMPRRLSWRCACGA